MKEGVEKPIQASPITLEWHELDQPYASLRAGDTRAEARLRASLVESGQTHPVVVIQNEQGRYVLIDGYRRADSLKRLAQDTLQAVVLGVGEAEALAYCHQQETSRRRTPLEEGWLVRELIEGHHKTPSEVGSLLLRSTTWVSRRLGLAKALPKVMQDAVIRGQLPAHGVEKSLLPLARANAEDARRLFDNVGNEKLTTRQMATIYTAYKNGNFEQRQRIVGAPLLFLKVTNEPPSLKRDDNEIARLARDMTIAGKAGWRAHDRLQHLWSQDQLVLDNAAIKQALKIARAGFETLFNQVGIYDRSGHAHGDTAPCASEE